jgi:AcrR family transcriptional regulator
MPRGKFQQKQWEARETAILDALQILATAQGFANVTMDDLAQEVGISKATLYQHFESKDAMMICLMAQHTRQFVAWLESTADQPPLKRLCQTMRYLMTGDIQPLRGLIHLGRDELVPLFQSDLDLVAEHARAIETLGDIVRAGQAQGTIAPDLAPDVIIGAMWAMSKVSLSTGASLVDASEDYATQMVTLFERGVSLCTSRSAGHAS